MWNKIFQSKKQKNGFTLIELMVVVAIIGLLVALSLVALKHYRDEGIDAAIKIELLSVRNVAELYYSEHPNGFEKVCYDEDDVDLNPEDGTPGFDDGTLNDDTFGSIENSIIRKGGVITCNDDFSFYAVISSLKAADCWCIDSTGDSKEVNNLGSGETCKSWLGNSTDCTP